MRQFKGILFAMISSSTFGLIPFFALPVLQAGIGLDSLLFYRFAISSVLVGAFLLVRGTRLRVSWPEVITLFGLGAAYASTALFLTASYLYIPSGVATTIHFLYPVLVTGIGIVFFKDRLSVPVVLATVMAIFGVFLLGGGAGTGTISWKGLVMVLSTVVTYAVYIVGVNHSLVRDMDGLKMTFYMLFACAVIFGVNVLVKGGGLDVMPDASAVVHVFLLALIPTLVSDFTLILAIQRVGSTTAAVLGCMEPLTAVSVGIFFLGERFGTGQLPGMGIVIAAVSIVIVANHPGYFPVKRLLPAFLYRKH